jgi:hypothetical protein
MTKPKSYARPTRFTPPNARIRNQSSSNIPCASATRSLTLACPGPCSWIVAVSWTGNGSSSAVDASAFAKRLVADRNAGNPNPPDYSPL